METVAEKESQQTGALGNTSNVDYELVDELRKRMDAQWRYSECLANAGEDPEMQQTWQILKLQEQAKIKELKALIASRIEKGEFLNEY